MNVYLLVKVSGKDKTDGSVLVRDVIDGDTLVTETGSRIRLLRVDAPDLKNCLGEEAKNRLYELVVGKRVILKDQSGDNFGRILALVYVDDLFVNEVMLKEGLVRYQGGESSEKQKLQKAADIARESQLGIYSSLCRQKKKFRES